VSVLGPSLTNAIEPKWGADINPHANCGAFVGSFLTASGLLTANYATRTMTATAPFGTLLQTYNYLYEITGSNNPIIYAIKATA
jgi:hypothetical protein